MKQKAEWISAKARAELSDAVEDARGLLSRSEFIREALRMKLESMGFRLPADVFAMPDRARKRRRTKRAR